MHVCFYYRCSQKGASSLHAFQSGVADVSWPLPGHRCANMQADTGVSFTAGSFEVCDFAFRATILFDHSPGRSNDHPVMVV